MYQKHDKETVLKKGLSLFCNNGYNSVGINEICTKTGMTKGAFYHAFKSKEAFLLETLLLYGTTNVLRIRTKLQFNNNETPLERLEAFYIDMFMAQPKNNFMGCYINNMMSELGATNEIIGQATTIEFDNFIKVIEPTVHEAQISGELTKQMNAKEIAELLHSTFYGLLTRVKSSKNQNQSIHTMKLAFKSLKTNK